MDSYQQQHQQQGTPTPDVPQLSGGVPLANPYPQQQANTHIYVGNLSSRVTEFILQEIFAVAGPVLNVKIIPDRHFQHGGANYGFVEYATPQAAETAIATLNGRKIFDMEVRCNWAVSNNGGNHHHAQQQPKDDQNCHVFVGDLSPEVTDELLRTAFSAFPSLADARVMWDMNSGKSRGYGFVAFKDRTDAENAIATMNGEWLGSRAIRVNWANQKSHNQGGNAFFGQQRSFQQPVAALSYDAVLAQTPPYNTTVYVGNITPYTTQHDVAPLFQPYGYIVELRIQSDRGFAFVKLDTHENAAMAIVNLQGTHIHGRLIKCSWGKDRAGEAAALASASLQSTGLQGQLPLASSASLGLAYPNHQQQQLPTQEQDPSLWQGSYN